MKRFLLLISALLVLFLNRQSAAEQEHLTVGLVGSAPFVIVSDIEKPNDARGLSIDLWERIAKDRNVDYDFAYLSDSVDAALEQLEKKRLDIVIGPISITSKRHRHVVFTQPYFHAGIAIAAPAESTTWSKVRPFMTSTFLKGLAILIVVLLVVGFLTWLVERKKNDLFPTRPFPGILTGMWFAVTTMTTVGYGDKVPKTNVGRFLTASWMLVSLVSLSSLTAFISSTLTVAQLDETSISTAEELRSRKVAAIPGTTGQLFVVKHEGIFVPVTSVEKGFELLQSGKVDAVVHDKPVLSYVIDSKSYENISVSSSTYNVQGYGFAARNPELQNAVSTSILHLIESGTLDDIKQHWLGVESQ